jgi:hypothetical protein
VRWLLLGAALGLSLPLARGQASPPPSSEMVTIDGSKNPELVPEWTAWHSAFTRIRAANDIPSDVLSVIGAAERAAILDHAGNDGRFWEKGEKQVKDMQTAVVAEPDRARKIELMVSLQPKVEELELVARRHTLELRDHLLSILQPDGRAALMAWVQASKAGHRITVPKSKLEAFRKPG